VLIALVAVVLFAGSWFTVLRPKPVDDSAASTPAPAQATTKAPGQQGLENAVTKAKGAVATSKSSAQATERAPAKAGGATATTKSAGTKSATTKRAATTPAKAATPAKPATAKAPAATKVDPSRALLANLAHGRTVVLLFTQEGGADDRAARKAVRRLAAADKKVVTSIVPIGKVGDYEAITTGVNVLTAPTVLVIGPDRHAVPVSGYTDIATLKQVVGDVRRAAKPAASK
jgi:hypothetical protein